MQTAPRQWATDPGLSSRDPQGGAVQLVRAGARGNMEEHDLQRWGPLRAASAQREPLVRLAAVVRALMHAEQLAKSVAALRVLTALQAESIFQLSAVGDAVEMPRRASDSGGPVRFLPPPPRVQAWADRVGRDDWDEYEHDLAWERLPPALRALWIVHFERSTWGALRWLKWTWIDGADALTDLDDGVGGTFAVLESAAAAAFPALFPGLEAPSVQGASAGLQIVQPEGGRWPHIDRQPWTDAERWALFLMRHRDKRTGAQLAEIARTSRQRIDELIGKARPRPLSSARGEGGWTPPPALLALCGEASSPLQTVALALVR